MKKRNLDYEKKFRTYLFSFDFETHKQICKDLNVKHNQNEVLERCKGILQDENGNPTITQEELNILQIK